MLDWIAAVFGVALGGWLGWLIDRWFQRNARTRQLDRRLKTLPKR